MPDAPAAPSPLERLQAYLEGYPGYATPEARRVADPALREHLTTHLRRVNGEVRRLQGRLSAEGQFKPATDLHRLGRRLQRALESIERAAYGYAGFFAAAAVAPERLTGLYELDLRLVETAAGLAAAAEGLVRHADEARPERIAALSEALDELDHLLDLRAEAAAAAGPSEGD